MGTPQQVDPLPREGQTGVFSFGTIPSGVLVGKCVTLRKLEFDLPR
jgi:hypothetical protein